MLYSSKMIIVYVRVVVQWVMVMAGQSCGDTSADKWPSHESSHEVGIMVRMADFQQALSALWQHLPTCCRHVPNISDCAFLWISHPQNEEQYQTSYSKCTLLLSSDHTQQETSSVWIAHPQNEAPYQTNLSRPTVQLFGGHNKQENSFVWITCPQNEASYHTNHPCPTLLLSGGHT